MAALPCLWSRGVNATSGAVGAMYHGAGVGGGLSRRCPQLVLGQFGPSHPGCDLPSLPPSLFSSSLSTACLAWTLTGSLAREATRRARSPSPTWNCSAKQAPPRPLLVLAWAGDGAALPFVLSVGDLAAQGGD